MGGESYSTGCCHRSRIAKNKKIHVDHFQENVFQNI